MRFVGFVCCHTAKDSRCSALLRRSASFERKADLSKVLTSAFERGLIRMDVPGFDVLINLMAPPPASGRGGR